MMIGQQASLVVSGRSSEMTMIMMPTKNWSLNATQILMENFYRIWDAASQIWEVTAALTAINSLPDSTQCHVIKCTWPKKTHACRKKIKWLTCQRVDILVPGVHFEFHNIIWYVPIIIICWTSQQLSDDVFMMVVCIYWNNFRQIYRLTTITTIIATTTTLHSWVQRLPGRSSSSRSGPHLPAPHSPAQDPPRKSLEIEN